MNTEFIKQGIGLIRKAAVAYLTTIDSRGFPSTRALFNLKNSRQFPKLVDFMARYDDLTLFFTTNTSSAKIKHILNNPKVAVYYCDTDAFHGFMCQGEIEIVNDKAIKHAIWHDEWKLYYPDGRDSEDYSILKLEPVYIKRYFDLQQSEMML
jgi:general stress protein 26